jgi:hypothetical protein
VVRVKEVGAVGLMVGGDEGKIEKRRENERKVQKK